MFLASVFTNIEARTLSWEIVDSAGQFSQQVSLPSDEPGVEIYAERGYIYVRTDHEIPVSVYSILGQLVGSGVLQPGLYRMPMNAKGIYILRAGMSTLRVTL